MRTPKWSSAGARALAPIAFAAVALTASIAFARAGGGNHYASGSSSSSSGSSGGDSGVIFYLLELLLELTVHHPLGMLPVWAILIGCYVALKRNATRPTRETTAGISQLDAQRLTPSRPVQDAFSDLKQVDPSFDLAAFFARTKKVFVEIQQAWSMRKLEAVRQYMSDGVYRRFTTLLALMQLDGERNALADVQVLACRLQELTRTAAYDCLTVVIDASARDVDLPATLSDEDALRKAGAARGQAFTELWTFVRRRGAKTQPGLGEGRCPNCGAPFHGGATNTCEFCKTVVNSGNHDWVLTEITQPEVYLAHPGEPPGLRELKARDPDAAPELLQDRGLLLFWKWLQARAVGNARIMQKVATLEAGSALAAELEKARQAGKTFKVHEPAVGGASIAAIEQVGELFQVHVDIRWSAVLDGRATPARSILTMVRAADAKTDPGKGLSTERCGNCGAPLSDSTSVACEFCGQDLASPARCWQFQSLEPFERWQRPSVYAPRPAARSAFATSGERTRLLSVMVAIVKADGVVSRAELSMLRECARRWSVPWPLVQTLLESELSGPFDEIAPQSPQAAQAFVAQLVELARIDGRIDRKERNLIGRAGAKLGLQPQAVEDLLSRAS